MMKEELDAMRVDVAAQKVEPEDVMQEVGLEIEQDFGEMYDVSDSDSDSDSNGWAEIKEDEVETEQVWEVEEPAFDKEEFEKVSQVGQEEEEEVVVVVVDRDSICRGQGGGGGFRGVGRR